MDVLKSTTDTDKLKMKYDDLTDVDSDKCVNNQNICNNNLKNAKIIHDTDCNVLIDNNDNDNDNNDGNDNDNQTKQLLLQQQQQSPVQQPPLESSPQTPPSMPQQPSTYGCKHYKRKAKFVVSTYTNTHARAQIYNSIQQTNKFIRFKFY